MGKIDEVSEKIGNLQGSFEAFSKANYNSHNEILIQLRKMNGDIDSNTIRSVKNKNDLAWMKSKTFVIGGSGAALTTTLILILTSI